MRISMRFVVLGLVTSLFCAQVVQAQSIDLRSYFPQRLNYYRWADGTQTHFYNIFSVPQSQSDPLGSIYLNYFNQNLPGSSLLILQKNYSGCNYTYAFLVLGGGSDKRVKEVGDWYGPRCDGLYTTLGYRTFSRGSGAPTGLNWSTSGGLDTSWQQWNSMRVFGGISPYKYSGVDTYMSPGLVEVLPTWRPKYGRDEIGNWVPNPNKTYSNVARIRIYHGTTQSPRRCYGLDPNNPYSVLYYHGANHSSFGVELYMDQTHGILQETFLYSEHDMDGRAACDPLYPALASSANLQTALSRHEYYIDN